MNHPKILMAKLMLHIQANTKAYIRLFAMLLFVISVLQRFSYSFQLIASIIIFLMLIFDLLKRNYPKTQFEALSYYLFWIVAFLSIIIQLKLRYNYFDNFPNNNLPFLHQPLYEILFVKSTILIVSFIRYKSIIVTHTILSKLWLFIMFTHFFTLLTDSTYSFQYLSYDLAIISAVETILIIFTEKKLLIYKSTILDFLWKKK